MENKIKIEKLEFFKPTLNWIVFIILTFLGLVIYLYYKHGEFESVNIKLIFLSISIAFLLWGVLRKSYGIEYLPQYYKFLGMKSEFLIEALSSLPLVFHGIFLAVALLTSGKIIFVWCIQVALITFFYPIILSLTLRLIKPVLEKNKSNHKEFLINLLKKEEKKNARRN